MTNNWTSLLSFLLIGCDSGYSLFEFKELPQEQGRNCIKVTLNSEQPNQHREFKIHYQTIDSHRVLIAAYHSKKRFWVKALENLLTSGFSDNPAYFFWQFRKNRFYNYLVNKNFVTQFTNRDYYSNSYLQSVHCQHKYPYSIPISPPEYDECDAPFHSSFLIVKGVVMGYWKFIIILLLFAVITPMG